MGVEAIRVVVSAATVAVVVDSITLNSSGSEEDCALVQNFNV
jgi:hypothetical protein